MKLFRRLRYICKSFRFFFSIVYRPITGPVPGEEPWPWRKRWAMRVKPRQAWLIVKLGWVAWDLNDTIQRNQKAALEDLMPAIEAVCDAIIKEHGKGQGDE
jgi:hypothetical protein